MSVEVRDWSHLDRDSVSGSAEPRAPFCTAELSYLVRKMVGAVNLNLAIWTPLIGQRSAPI
jgi:hypothetical protein